MVTLYSCLGLLLLTRIVPVVEEFTTTAIDFTWHNILGVEGVTSDCEILYSPGTILIFAAIIAFILQRKSFSNFMNAAKESMLSIKDAALALFATLTLVQVFTNSGINGADLI